MKQNKWTSIPIIFKVHHQTNAMSFQDTLCHTFRKGLIDCVICETASESQKVYFNFN